MKLRFVENTLLANSECADCKKELLAGQVVHLCMITESFGLARCIPCAAKSVSEQLSFDFVHNT